jgi:hypothetical protein
MIDLLKLMSYKKGLVLVSQRTQNPSLEHYHAIVGTFFHPRGIEMHASGTND